MAGCRFVNERRSEGGGRAKRSYQIYPSPSPPKLKIATENEGWNSGLMALLMPEEALTRRAIGP